LQYTLSLHFIQLFPPVLCPFLGEGLTLVSKKSVHKEDISLIDWITLPEAYRSKAFQRLFCLVPALVCISFSFCFFFQPLDPSTDFSADCMIGLFTFFQAVHSRLQQTNALILFHVCSLSFPHISSFKLAVVERRIRPFLCQQFLMVA